MKGCTLCPNECGAARESAAGACGAGSQVKIAKYSLHAFEEPPVSGTNGSGTVFFCGCSLKCVFCQNFEVSRGRVGREISVERLAEIFKELERSGAHNINLVNPTHYADKIVRALKLAAPSVPVVWNTHGYERTETLKYVDDAVDVYLTDFKFFSEKASLRYTGKSDYAKVALPALEFMLNSKKTVLSGGLLKQGVIVRHLVLPLGAADSAEILTRIRPLMNGGAILSLMAQYTPFGEIDDFPELKRKITRREYERVLDKVYELKFENVFIQDFDSADGSYIPDWDF